METKLKDLASLKPSSEYTDEEINELAEFFRDLTIEQAFYLKDSYESFLLMYAKECGSEYVQ